MHRLTITLPLHFALAKSVADYLADAGDDKDRALEAMRRDIVQREGQNSKARTFQRAYGKLVEKLKLPEDPEDADSASEAALRAVTSLSEAGATHAQLTKLLTKLNLDPAKLEEQLTNLQQQAAQGAEASALRRDLAYRDAADGEQFDAAKLARVLRDEPGIPEKRSVKVQENGQEVTRDVWGLPTRDAQGKETGFTPLREHPDVKGFEAALRRDSATPPPPATPSYTPPAIPPQNAGTPPTGQVVLDPASVQASIAANGAGRI